MRDDDVDEGCDEAEYLVGPGAMGAVQARESRGTRDVATALGRPGSTLNRRAFLLAALGGALALATGRRLADAGAPATVGVLRPKRADNLVEEPLDAGVDLRPTPLDKQGPTFHLNGPGAFVWRRIDGERSVGLLARELGAAYDLPPDVARADTLAFLRSMTRIGLVFDPMG